MTSWYCTYSIIRNPIQCVCVCVYLFWLGGDIQAKRKVATMCVACQVSVKLMLVCLPSHDLQSSSLLYVTSNAPLMHLVPMRLQFQRKRMTILQGTRCWISGSKWRRSRTSLITGTKNRASTKREGVRKGLPVCLSAPIRCSGTHLGSHAAGTTVTDSKRKSENCLRFFYTYNRNWIQGLIQTPTRN